jgi:hypothetical protein
VNSGREGQSNVARFTFVDALRRRNQMNVPRCLAALSLVLATQGFAQPPAAVDAGKPAAAAPAPAAAEKSAPAAIPGRAGAAAPKGYARAVKYPDGYRHWTHVKTTILEKGHPLFDQFGGMHHVYANEKALKAWQENKALPTGSVLIFDLLETKAEDNSVVEGTRKVLAVMERDTKAFASTGGWGFEAFKGDTRDRLVTDPQGCFSCHQKQAATSDFVFSSWRP